MYSYFYNFTLSLYEIGLHFAAFFYPKAKLWVKGRKEQEKMLAHCAIPTDKKKIWFHCASLGEFEQGRPVIEALRKKHENIFIVLTFFSPSGYEIRKDYETADLVLYLPLDRPKKVVKFIAKINPQIALFVKYEIWPNYFNELNKKGVPILLISAIFRENQRFFNSIAKQWFKKPLEQVTHFFVQNETSQSLLKSIGITQVTISGDTRFDRVVSISNQSKPIEKIKEFFTGEPVLILGSSWPADEDLVFRYKKKSNLPFKIIIAPHEIHQSRITKLQEKFKDNQVITFSAIDPKTLPEKEVLIVDNIGMLSQLYATVTIAYIGGGFGKGIHNTLEAAAYGIPIIIGPNYQKFKEAIDLIGDKAAFSVFDQAAFDAIFTKMLEDPTFRKESGNRAKKYVNSKCGASQIIVNYLDELV